MRRAKGLFRHFRSVAATVLVAGALAGCQDVNTKAAKPIPSETLALMEKNGTSKSAPMLIRAYKKEAELEIWKQKSDGQYALLKKYPMCRWSGQLGPKTREGDRQVPEGFYNITPGQMNPNSSYYLSFNVGYPNAFDRAHGRGGGLIMVHGACSSAGCFSMTDDQIAEIYAIARESFAGGQRAIQMQSMPFRMTAENLARHRSDPNMPFWRNLKEGSDYFEVARTELDVGVCGRRYVFNARPAGGARLDPSAACPTLQYEPELRNQVAARQRHDDQKVAELIGSGVKAVKVVYADGGQHPEFADKGHDVSRPDALARGPVEIALDDRKGRKTPAVVQLATVRGDTPAAAKPSSADALAMAPKEAAIAPSAKLETILDPTPSATTPDKPSSAQPGAAKAGKALTTATLKPVKAADDGKARVRTTVGSAAPAPAALVKKPEASAIARAAEKPKPAASASTTQLIAGSSQSLPAGFALTTSR
jgi:murein L,D-transpeptidase YafK